MTSCFFFYSTMIALSLLISSVWIPNLINTKKIVAISFFLEKRSLKSFRQFKPEAHLQKWTKKEAVTKLEQVDSWLKGRKISLGLYNLKTHSFNLVIHICVLIHQLTWCLCAVLDPENENLYHGGNKIV